MPGMSSTTQSVADAKRLFRKASGAVGVKGHSADGGLPFQGRKHAFDLRVAHHGLLQFAHLRKAFLSTPSS
eukprot:10443730-Lingulodinium_polyedra.AAC.1